MWKSINGLLDQKLLIVEVKVLSPRQIEFWTLEISKPEISE